MKPCQTIHDQFDDRLDHRLDAAQTAAFDAHLAACSACRQEWQAHFSLWDTLGQQPVIEPSFGFAQRTLRRLHEPPATPWRWPVWRWATAASLLLLILAAGGWLVRQRHEQTAQQVAAYQAIEQDRLDDFDVIASLDQLEGDNRL